MQAGKKEDGEQSLTRPRMRYSTPIATGFAAT